MQTTGAGDEISRQNIFLFSQVLCHAACRQVEKHCSDAFIGGQELKPITQSLRLIRRRNVRLWTFRPVTPLIHLIAFTFELHWTSTENIYLSLILTSPTTFIHLSFSRSPLFYLNSLLLKALLTWFMLLSPRVQLLHKSEGGALRQISLGSRFPREVDARKKGHNLALLNSRCHL